MKAGMTAGLAVLLAMAMGCATGGLKGKDNRVLVVMETELGVVEMAVDVERAPVTGYNFMRYVDGKFYDGGRFHRVVRLDNQKNEVKIEVIQGDINAERRKEGYPAIALERTNVTGLRHKDGALSMARGGPDSATAGFFICINDQPELDFGGRRNADGQGFAAFGEVVKGMDVVRKIQQGATEGETLKQAVKIISMRRKE